MRILVDADACPVVGTVEKMAKKIGCPCILFHDYAHSIESDYSEVRVVECGRDAVDFAIVSECMEGDVVITNDAGLAAMVFHKAAKVINANGKAYTEQMIEEKMFYSYIAKTCRRTNHYRGVRKKKKFNPGMSRISSSLAACAQ